MSPGQRLMRFQNAGWEFADGSTHVAGANHIYKTDNVGSIVRIPAGQDEFLYLMRIHKDWYDEDQVSKETRILDTENQYKNQGQEGHDGMYGSVSIDYDK